MSDDDITFGPTPIGQLIYDLGWTKLSDDYLARKHGLPIDEIRKCRVAFKKGFAEGRKLDRMRKTKSKRR
jgi:hypothetical protein